MKLVVFTVVSIVAFRANCHDLPDGLDPTDGPDDGGNPSNGRVLPNGSDDEAFTIEPEPFAGEAGDQLFSTDVDVDISTMEPGLALVQDEIEHLEDSDEDQQMKEDESEQIEHRQRGGSKCKSAVVCSLLGGSCVTNSTYCSGREVPGLCTGAKCKCCIPVNLEVRVHDLENVLRSMVVNLTTANSNLMTLVMSANSNLTITNSKLNLKIDSINSNFTDANSNIKNELQFIKENLTNSNAYLDSQLDSIKKKQGCPKGLFSLGPSNQCFQLLNDTTRNWYTANAACRAKGLFLGQPADPVAMRNYIVITYGDVTYTWIGARGTGSYVKFERSSRYIGSSHPLWYSRSTSSSYCLAMTTRSSMWKSYGDRLYYTLPCSYGYWALCELVRE